MSTSEKVLWHYLRHGRLSEFRFRRQVPVLDYILDFYCGEAMLCVEVDGEQHRHQSKYDAKRDQALAEAGILTIRIPSLDLFEGPKELLDHWLWHIEATCWWRACE